MRNHHSDNAIGQKNQIEAALDDLLEAAKMDRAGGQQTLSQLRTDFLALLVGPASSFEQQLAELSMDARKLEDCLAIPYGDAQAILRAAVAEARQQTLESAAEHCNVLAVELRGTSVSKMPTVVEVANSCRDSILALGSKSWQTAAFSSPTL